MDEVATAEDTLPLSRCITLSRCAANNQLQLSLAETFARRFRKAYGYIAEIKLGLAFFPDDPKYLETKNFGVNFVGQGEKVNSNSGEGCSAPAQLQAVTMIPWRSGTTAGETLASFVYVRINAFVSKALFHTPVQVLAVGEPFVGFAEPTNGDSQSAQLVSWSPTFRIQPLKKFPG